MDRRHHTYLADAIRDGLLIDITEATREVGFVVPVAIIQDVWNDCVAWTRPTQDRKGFTAQSEAGRLHDLVWMTWHAVRRTNDTSLTVELFRVPPRGRDIEARHTKLHANIGRATTEPPRW